MQATHDGTRAAGTAAVVVELLGIMLGEPVVSALRHAFLTSDYGSVCCAIGASTNHHVRAAAQEAHRRVSGRTDLLPAAVLLTGNVDCQQGLATGQHGRHDEAAEPTTASGGTAAQQPPTRAPAPGPHALAQATEDTPHFLCRHEKVQLARLNDTFSGDFFKVKEQQTAGRRHAHEAKEQQTAGRRHAHEAKEHTPRKSALAEALAPGTPVTVVRLADRPDLNGQHGVVQKKRTEAYKPGFLVVLLDSSKVVPIPNANLLPRYSDSIRSTGSTTHATTTTTTTTTSACAHTSVTSNVTGADHAQQHASAAGDGGSGADADAGGGGGGGGHVLPGNSAERPRRRVGIVTCDVEQPSNSGSICRLLANFAPEGSVYTHVLTAPGISQATKTPDSMLNQGRFKGVAAGTQKRLRHVCETTEQFCLRLRTGLHWPDTAAPATLAARATRPPLVVIETAKGAQNVFDFTFPPVCDIVVGGETMGVHRDILDCLVEGYDSTVYISSTGFIKQDIKIGSRMYFTRCHISCFIGSFGSQAYTFHTPEAVTYHPIMNLQ